jgi:hypothetical protein
MSDNDLIRRGDAIKAVDDWQGDWSCTVLALSALPAVQPKVKPLVWLQHPTRLGELFADAEFGAYSVSDPTGRGCWQWQWHLMGALLDQSNQELALAFPTRGDAIAAAEGHRKARILSALESPAQPDAAAIRKTAWNIAVEMELDAAMSTKTAAKAGAIEAAIRALIDNPGKEVVPIVSDDPANQSDIGPGDQAVAGAAQIKAAWPEDARSLLAEADARIAWESLGFGADFAERVEAALESDPPEEIGILQARVEDQDRKIADLTRQLQGQPRRQSDVSADTWQPIATAPKDRVIDLWSAEGGRYPDAVWDVCCDAEGWTDANDHRSLASYRFTHWMDRPAGPTEGGE